MRKILIIDNESKTTCKACYRFRENVHACYKTVQKARHELPNSLTGYSHLVLTGGGGDFDDEDPKARRLKALIREAAKKKIPTLGICFGFEIMLAAFGTDKLIRRYDHPEVGWTRITRSSIRPSRLLHNLPRTFYAFEHHRNDAVRVPTGFVVTASSRRCAVQAAEHEDLPIFGVQFHPEISRSRARAILHRFHVARYPKTWLSYNPSKRSHYGTVLSRTIFENFYASENGVPTKPSRRAA